MRSFSSCNADWNTNWLAQANAFSLPILKERIQYINSERILAGLLELASSYAVVVMKSKHVVHDKVSGLQKKKYKYTSQPLAMAKSNWE